MQPIIFGLWILGSSLFPVGNTSLEYSWFHQPFKSNLEEYSIFLDEENNKKVEVLNTKSGKTIEVNYRASENAKPFVQCDDVNVCRKEVIVSPVLYPKTSPITLPTLPPCTPDGFMLPCMMDDSPKTSPDESQKKEFFSLPGEIPSPITNDIPETNCKDNTNSLVKCVDVEDQSESKLKDDAQITLPLPF